MSSTTRVATAITAGYFLGRFKKLRLAIIVGSALANENVRAKGLGMLTKGSQGLTSSPEAKKLTQQISGQLAEAGKAAAVSVAAGRIDKLSDRLNQRSEMLRGVGHPADDREDDSADDQADDQADEPEDEPTDEADEDEFDEDEPEDEPTDEADEDEFDEDEPEDEPTDEVDEDEFDEDEPEDEPTDEADDDEFDEEQDEDEESRDRAVPDEPRRRPSSRRNRSSSPGRS